MEIDSRPNNFDVQEIIRCQTVGYVESKGAFLAYLTDFQQEILGRYLSSNFSIVW